MSAVFDLAAALPVGRTVIQASAGTGKTYSLTGLIVRYVAEEAVPVEQFLVVTFTRAAANDLRDRTRSALRSAIEVVRDGTAPEAHGWMETLLTTAHPAGSAAHDHELEQRLRRLQDAVNRFDELTVTTIHGFCQQALGQLGVRAGTDPSAVLVETTADLVAEVCRDLIVTELSDAPTALDSPRGSDSKVRHPSHAESHLIRTVTALMNNPGATIAPVLPHPNGGSAPGDLVNDAMATHWLRLAATALRDVEHRQRQRGEIGYDSLIAAMRDALLDPVGGGAVADLLASRSSVVLVDEFQDTDRMQWEVFDTAYAGQRLITVGDPKQAIYRFRGADVHAYLDAVGAVDARSLATNYRSDQQLLAGLAHLFAGATLGDERIPFEPVAARPDAPHNGLTIDTAGARQAAVQLRVVPLEDSLRAGQMRDLSMPLVRTLVLADLVTRTVELLDHGSITDATGNRRGVRPADIAILVPSHAEANNVAEAMRRARIPAVRTRTGSVTETAAATQWRLLLAALAQPHRAGVVRAAALGWFLPTDIVELTASDDLLVALQEHVATLADRLRHIGISAFYDEQKSSRPDRVWGAGVLTTVLGREGGERHLTDLDHIAELLAESMHGRTCDPAQVLRTLDELIRSADDRSEASMRRIDSDAQAVQITTIHSAKGLEYPIVLVPFGFKQRANLRLPHSYIAPDGTRTIDVASTVGWDAGLMDPDDPTSRYSQVARREWSNVDTEGDELRLLYVALTRAQHRLEIWWASTQRATTSALGRLLLDRTGGGPVENSRMSLRTRPVKRGVSKVLELQRPGYVELPEPAVMAQLHALAASSGGAIDITELPTHVDPPAWTGGRRDAAPILRAATSAARPGIADLTWRRWSFSALGAQLETDRRDGFDAIVRGTDRAPDDARGGNDEPPEHDEALVPVGDLDDPTLADEAVAAAHVTGDGIGGAAATGSRRGRPVSTDQLSLFAPAVAPAAPSVVPLADVGGGTRFGTFVHAVLEDLDFAADDLDARVRVLVEDHARRAGLDLPPHGPTSDVVGGVLAALRTPLGPLFGHRPLTAFGPKDRLAELTFDLPLLRGRSSDRPITAGSIGDVLLATLADDDPMRPFAAQLADDMAGLDISGWMHGSIDAVFRVPDPHVALGHRYVVVDYKTNRLHEAGAPDPVVAYRPDRLVGAMEHSRYPLQALLYTVALHRYLRWRLGPVYSPDQHLGGTGYLFLRGMIGPNTPVVDHVAHGVCSWRPAAAAILAIDRLFADGSLS